MRTLRLRLITLFVSTALVVAAVIVVAVQYFSAEQLMHFLMDIGESPASAQAMFDEYVGRVVLLGAAVAVLLGVLAALSVLERILRPLDQLTRATRAVAAGDFGERVPEPPDAELRSLATAFNQMAASLERVEHLRRSLVEDVAHELRTPLTTLRGYTEALADGILAPTPETLRTVHEEIERLTRLIEGLDQLARGEHEHPAETWTEVDLRSVVHHAIELVSPELASRGITARIVDTAELPPVHAASDAIGRVVGNLVQNAARYANDGGTITATLRVQDAWVCCAIENTGPEIPPEELSSIWERLHRVDRSRTRASGGAGIGLAIVRQIIEAHGGSVGASSGNGRTEVWFQLRAAQPA